MIFSLLFRQPGLDDAAGHALAVLIRDNGLDLGLAADLADADNRALDGQRVADENRLGEFALHAVEPAVLAGQIDARQRREKARPGKPRPRA